MNALVLSGGGGKGAYQIGVWKALRKLNYKIDIVTGTSVGSLNAVLIAQNSWFLAPIIWNKIDFSSVFQTDTKKEQSIQETIKMYGENIIKNKGMSTDNLEANINKLVNYKKFYNSNVNFGLVTYNLTNLKPKVLTKEQIPKNKLKDYLIASCTFFPAFKLKDINGKKYIDGGFYDVLPINLAIDMGATNIIAVDLKSIGLRRVIKNRKIPITYILPRNKIGYTLVFDKKTNKKNIQYGYNDTMKVFNCLEGNKFTFKKGTIKDWQDNYSSLFKKNLLYFLNIKENTHNQKILNLDLLNYFINNEPSTYGILPIIEKTLKTFTIPDYKIYSLFSSGILLESRLKSIPLNDTLKISSTKKEKIKYLYTNMINNNINLVKKKALLYPNEFISALYLYTIIKGVNNAI